MQTAASKQLRNFMIMTILVVGVVIASIGFTLQRLYSSMEVPGNTANEYQPQPLNFTATSSGQVVQMETDDIDESLNSLNIDQDFAQIDTQAELGI